MVKIKDLPKIDRPREKLEKKGRAEKDAITERILLVPRSFLDPRSFCEVGSEGGSYPYYYVSPNSEIILKF